MCGGVEAGVAARSSVLCSVTHNSCSVVSLKERINDVSGNGTTGAVKKKGVCVCRGVCLLCFQYICFRSSCLRNGCVLCPTIQYDSVCSPVDCLSHDEGFRNVR